MGQWYDEESGLHYNLHRYYDPQTGQYLSTDPLGLQGGLNTHAYVHDPVNWCDPWGLTDVNATGINGQGYDIYRIYDVKTGRDIYVGMTENFEVRQQQHTDSGRIKPGMKMERIDHTKTYGEARGVEQYNIEKRGALDLDARGQYDKNGKIPAGKEGNRANSYDRSRELNPEDKRAEAFKKGHGNRSGKCGI